MNQNTEKTTENLNVFIPQVKFMVDGQVLLARVMKQNDETVLLRTTTAIYSVPKDQVEPC